MRADRSPQDAMRKRIPKLAEEGQYWCWYPGDDDGDEMRDGSRQMDVRLMMMWKGMLMGEGN